MLTWRDTAVLKFINTLVQKRGKQLPFRLFIKNSNKTQTASGSLQVQVSAKNRMRLRRVLLGLLHNITVELHSLQLHNVHPAMQLLLRAKPAAQQHFWTFSRTFFFFLSHSNMHISNNHHHHHHHSKCCCSENFSRPYNPGTISDFRQDTSCHSDDYNYMHCSFMRKQHVHVTTSQQPVFWGDDSSGSAAPQDRSMKSVCPESRLWVHTEDDKYCTSQEVTKEKEESWFMRLYFIFPALSHFLLHLVFFFSY